jgi:hypothetical protein
LLKSVYESAVARELEKSRHNSATPPPGRPICAHSSPKESSNNPAIFPPWIFSALTPSTSAAESYIIPVIYSGWKIHFPRASHAACALETG